MDLILWIIAAALVIVGIVQLVQGQVVLGLVLIVLGLLVGPGGVSIFGAQPAGALALQDPPVGPDSPAGAFLTINNSLVLVLTGAILPLVNGLLLRPSNPGWVKVLVAGIVATVAHAIGQAVQADGSAVLSQEWALGLAVTVVGMVVAYLGFWGPALNPNATLPTVPVGDGLARLDRRAKPSESA